MPQSPLRARLGFLEAIEVDPTIGLVHDSYHRWERGRRFLLWMKISCLLLVDHSTHTSSGA
jgi:hypothetical protein